jgi:uncharacterized protein (DUF885 family)
MTIPLSRRTAIALGTSVALVPLIGCKPAPKLPAPTAANIADADFAKLAQTWLDAVAKSSPAFATSLGDHRFDGELDDVSATGRTARATLVKQTAAALAAIDRTKLSRDNQVDAAMLSEQMEVETFSLEVNQDWSWDPLQYNDIGSGALYKLMTRDFAPLQQRLLSAASRMEKLPEYLAQVRGTLDIARVPGVHATTYSGQNGGAISIIDELIVPSADKLGPDDRKRLMVAADKARAAVKQHQTWIDRKLVPGARGDYQLGATRFDTKLRLSINESTARDEVRRRAEADFISIREQMFDIAKTVLATQKGARQPPAAPNDAQKQAAVTAVYALSAQQQPQRDQLFEYARRTLDEATAYVREHELITLPDAAVKVIEMPKFQQGVAVAYCEAPGPLERKLETFYVISPIPKQWTDAQSKSFLGEYNSKLIYELSVHEAMPGHYVQIWHSNRHPSLLRAVLGSGPFVEGWACYAEDMMIEQGFGADDPLRRLANLKMRLRSVANAILDQGVHVDGWDQAKAMDFMVRQAFQQEREANGKWTRARVSSGQLSTYFVGMTGHHALRKDAESRQGAAFKLKAYHDSVLSHGSPPLRFVRQLMFDQAIV